MAVTVAETVQPFVIRGVLGTVQLAAVVVQVRGGFTISEASHFALSLKKLLQWKVFCCKLTCNDLIPSSDGRVCLSVPHNPPWQDHVCFFCMFSGHELYNKIWSHEYLLTEKPLLHNLAYLAYLTNTKQTHD